MIPSRPLFSLFLTISLALYLSHHSSFSTLSLQHKIYLVFSFHVLGYAHPISRTISCPPLHILPIPQDLHFLTPFFSLFLLPTPTSLQRDNEREEDEKREREKETLRKRTKEKDEKKGKYEGYVR